MEIEKYIQMRDTIKRCVPEGYEASWDEPNGFLISIKKEGDKKAKTLLQILPAVGAEGNDQYYRIVRIGNYIPFNNASAIKIENITEWNLKTVIENALTFLELI